MKRRSHLAGITLAVGFWGAVSAQDQAALDPQVKQFEMVTKLLREGKPAEAERLLEQAHLQSSESKFQLGDLTINSYAFTSTILISTYISLNDYSNAERVATDRVTWAEKQYGSAAFQVGGALIALANIERLQGKYKEAEPLYLRSLSIHRAVGFGDCLVGREVYTGLAETYLALKRSREAEELLALAIKACRDEYGARGGNHAPLLNVYAVALESDSQPDEAAKAAGEADRVGSSDPRFQQEERDLLRGRLLAAQGKFDESVSFCRKWIAIFEVPEGQESDRRLMLPLEECERILRLAGRDAEASDAGTRLNEIRTKYDVHF
jgi:tetratricopeptide (TPR) repeat protein